MEFSGEFELEGVQPEEAWMVMSDPVAVKQALRGCQYITRITDDFSFEDYEPPEDPPTLPEADPEDVADRAFQAGETYAALMQVGVGSVKPRFETRITIEEREFPRMVATGRGSASSSSFEMESWMDVSETETGCRIEWGAETTISGRVAQMGSRVLKPVANKVVNDFFNKVEASLTRVEERDEGGGLRDTLRNLV